MARFSIKVDQLTVWDARGWEAEVVVNDDEFTIKHASRESIRALGDLFATIAGDTNNEIAIIDVDGEILHYIELHL